MSPEWGTLPLLPLRCILEHLSVEDAMSAMSTCKHWRNTILLYEGRKDKLRLSVKDLEKSLYVARVFRKHTRKLHVYLDCKDEDVLDHFMSYVIPIFFDTVKLREIAFIGPSYIQQNHFIPIVKLKRIITESLIYKHMHNLQRLSFLGCEMGIAKGETENISAKHLEFYSRHLSFSHSLNSDAALSRCTPGRMVFSALQHLIVDYEHINTESLEEICAVSPLEQVTLNIGYKRQLSFTPVDWDRLEAVRGARLQVAVNIISMPHTKFGEIVENVLNVGMLLVSIRVLFCKTLYTPLLEHLVRSHKDTLMELVWADSPYNSTDVYHRVMRPSRLTQYGINNVNPFVLLCWQCTQLRRLVIHGYWIWQYDLLGFVRLRPSLELLEVSAVHDRQDEFGDSTPRVLALDHQPTLHREFVEEMSEYSGCAWLAAAWNRLHPALRLRSTPAHRADYVAGLSLKPPPHA